MAIVESFAGIVSLIGQYRAEKGAAEQSDFNEFIEWLVKVNHQEIKELLLINAKAAIGVKAILSQDRKIMFKYLERMDQALMAFTTNADGFRDLAIGIKPNSVLSEQALSILMQFESSGATKVYESYDADGVCYTFIDGSCGNVTITESRFIEDDFNTLSELGLLRLERQSEGRAFYSITRAAISLVKSS